MENEKRKSSGKNLINRNGYNRTQGIPGPLYCGDVTTAATATTRFHCRGYICKIRKSIHVDFFFANKI